MSTGGWGRIAVVTGASSGIGRELAREAARAGYDLVLVARRQERLEALAAELSGVNARPVVADLAEPAGIERVAAEIGEAPVEVLVNDAGIGGRGAFAIERDLQADLAMLRLNVMALVHLTGLFLPGMVERGHGGVLNVASIAGLPARTAPSRLQREQGLREVLQPSRGRGDPRHRRACQRPVSRAGGHRVRLRRRHRPSQREPADAGAHRDRGGGSRLGRAAAGADGGRPGPAHSDRPSDPAFPALAAGGRERRPTPIRFAMTVDARTTERPARGGLAAAYALSITLACGAIAVSIFGLLGPNAELAQPPSVLVSRAGDLANLLVLVPALLVTSRLARRGSFLGLLLWPGALFYAVYINAVYLLTAPFAVLVFGYLGLVVLAAATVIALLCDIDGAVVRRRLTAAPAQMTGTVLVPSQR